MTEISSKNRIKLKVVIVLMLLGMVLGLIFPIFSDGFDTMRPYVVGGTIGLLSGFFISVFELFVFTRIMRKSRFIGVILVRTCSYVIMISAIVLIAVAFIRSVDLGTSLLDVIMGEGFRNYVFHEEFIIVVAYAFALAFVANFIRIISKKMGQGVLWHLITGKYHRPREEEVIFMFLDLTGSTSIAEKLGHIQFHHLINDFFYDITSSILNNRGEIYHYVGDDVVVTWTMKNGLAEANCIRTYYDAFEANNNESGKYLKIYGLVPAFKAGFHCGKVVRGEIGDVKSEIAYHGDVVNTTARIMAQSGSLNKNLLLSSNLLELLPNLDGFHPEKLEEIVLRGKEKSIVIFGTNVV
jgi:adenylate cyclase